MNTRSFVMPAIVLVGSQGAGNIGSVARVMANFGLSDLRLVAPEVDHLGDEARRMAVKASALLERAAVHETLFDALADCDLAIGTTRRFGKYREEFLLPEQLAPTLALRAPQGRSALVFGREVSGLQTSELDLCQLFLTIPTAPALPSLNLAQSVAITLYALSSGSGQSAALPERPAPAGVAETEAMFRHMRASLLEIGFLDEQNPDHILRSFRRLFGRADLDAREVRMLQGLWSRLDWLAGELRAAKPVDGEDP